MKPVCFSDESVYQVMCDKEQYVRRRVKHPTSLMVWSVVSSKGLGRLYIVQGTMRKDEEKPFLRIVAILRYVAGFKMANHFIS